MTPRREHRLVFLLSVAQRRLQRWIAAQTERNGVTSAQAGLLFVLGQRDGVFRQVVRQRLEWSLREGNQLYPETVSLWNDVA